MLRSLVSFLSLLFVLAFLSSAQAQDILPELIKKIEGSVVSLIAYDKDGKAIARGSGFFINQKGDMITSRHVLLDAHEAEITTASGKTYKIHQVIAEDIEGDVIKVSVKIPSKNVRALTLGTYIPEVGERVIVIGSPLGLVQTVTDGIVSAIRDIPAFGRIVQIVAPISPG